MSRTKKSLSFVVLALLVVTCSVSLAAAAEVSQGKCVAYDQDKKSISIEEYNLNFNANNPYGEPSGEMSTFNVATAVIGITPQAGDILRIAYEVKGTERVALKVMNVSKQDLMKK